MDKLRTVKIKLKGLYQSAEPFDGILRVKLSRPAKSEETGICVFPEEWQTIAFSSGGEAVAELIPNSLLGEGTFYNYEIVCNLNTGAYVYDKYGKKKTISKGIFVVPEADCDLADIVTLDPPVEVPIDASALNASKAKAYAREAEVSALASGDHAMDSRQSAEEAGQYAEEAKQAASAAAQSSAIARDAITQVESIAGQVSYDKEAMGQTLAGFEKILNDKPSKEDLELAQSPDMVELSPDPNEGGAYLLKPHAINCLRDISGQMTILMPSFIGIEKAIDFVMVLDLSFFTEIPQISFDGGMVVARDGDDEMLIPVAGACNVYFFTMVAMDFWLASRVTAGGVES
jgi:hypothetical protein